MNFLDNGNQIAAINCLIDIRKNLAKGKFRNAD